MLEYRLKFHWSLFLAVQWTILQHWFREWLSTDQATSHYLDQWWLDYRRIYASLRLNELKAYLVYSLHNIHLSIIVVCAEYCSICAMVRVGFCNDSVTVKVTTDNGNRTRFFVMSILLLNTQPAPLVAHCYRCPNHEVLNSSMLIWIPLIGPILLKSSLPRHHGHLPTNDY